MSAVPDAAGVDRSRILSYDGFTIQVRAGSEGVLTWLEEFMTPSFATGSAAVEADVVVSLIVSRSALSAWLEEAHPAGRDVECFTMDREHVRWSLLQRPEGGTFAYGRQEEVALWSQRAGRAGGREVTLLAASDDRLTRLALMRTVREMALHHGLGRGQLLLHAAAVSSGADVTLIVGPKRSGKTSLLVHALQHPGTSYLANDRVLVAAEGSHEPPGDSPTAHAAYGVPTIVRLRDGALDWFPALRAAMGTRIWRFDRSRAEQDAPDNGDATRLGRGERATAPTSLSPGQFLELLGCAGASHGTVARLVFPNIAASSDTPGFALRRLAPDEVASRMLGAGLLASGRVASYLSESEAHAATDARHRLEDAVRALASRAPGFACALGPRAYRRPSVWEAIRGA